MLKEIGVLLLAACAAPLRSVLGAPTGNELHIPREVDETSSPHKMLLYTASQHKPPKPGPPEPVPPVVERNPEPEPGPELHDELLIPREVDETASAHKMLLYVADSEPEPAAVKRNPEPEPEAEPNQFSSPLPTQLDRREEDFLKIVLDCGSQAGTDFCAKNYGYYCAYSGLETTAKSQNFACSRDCECLRNGEPYTPAYVPIGPWSPISRYHRE